MTSLRPKLDIPSLSLGERDRRWAAVRKEMDTRQLDVLVLWGWPAVWDFYTANARYLCPVGGNAEFNVLVFPRTGEPTCFVSMATFVDGWRASQDWVQDIRPRRGTWADTVSQRLQELGLSGARVGMDGLAGPLEPDGWLPYSVYERLRSLLPRAKINGLDDMLELLRAIKSPEELQMLKRAAGLGDMMLATCRETARPGIREAEIYGRMAGSMLANGGEEPTLFLWACGRYPPPHPFRSPTMRSVELGDLITCEIHPKICGYFTHIERTFSVGAPEAQQRRIYDVCVTAFHEGMKMFGPGRPISAAMDHVRDVIHDAGCGMCETGIHGHGLASLEYPRYRHHAIKADLEALGVLGDAFRENMVFAFNIDLFDPTYRDGQTGCVFAETVQITPDGARRMHEYSMDFQEIPV